MVSRRKILSRSRDDLNLETSYPQPEEEEDVWYQKDKLFKVSNFPNKKYFKKFIIQTVPMAIIKRNHNSTWIPALNNSRK
jgi:hypothetical protein